MYEGMHEPAIAAFRRGIDLAKDSSLFITYLAEAFTAGVMPETRKITREQLRTLSEGQYMSAECTEGKARDTKTPAGLEPSRKRRFSAKSKAMRPAVRSLLRDSRDLLGELS